MDFKNEAGISQEDMEQALTDIQARIDAMSIDGNAQAMELAADIENNIGLARKNITAAFAVDSTSGGSQSTEEGGGE